MSDGGPVEFDDARDLYKHVRRRFEDPEEAEKLPDPRQPNVVHKPRIKQPTAREMRVFSDKRQKTCGMCQHFRHDAGQQEMKNQDFLRWLVYEASWKISHLCDEPQNMALCDQNEGMLVGPNSLACEFFTVRRW